MPIDRMVRFDMSVWASSRRLSSRRRSAPRELRPAASASARRTPGRPGSDALDGPRAHVQPPRDLGVGVAGGDKLCHPRLGWRQPIRAASPLQDDPRQLVASPRCPSVRAPTRARRKPSLERDSRARVRTRRRLAARCSSDPRHALEDAAHRAGSRPIQDLFRLCAFGIPSK